MSAKEILLLTMSMRNIKGIKDFTLIVDGKNATIYGENGTGKTTNADGFLWGLFDKDSTDRSKFSLKPTDENGQEYHGLEHEVILELLVDGVKRTIRKQLTEKWTKKNGETEKVFTGHETKYWVDDVPTPAGEFTKRIGEIIAEAAFKLLTNPFYFNEKLSWTERRKVLIQLAGDISDTAVIASDKSLADLSTLLSKHKDIDDLKKIINERIKNTNTEMVKIPVRIDEINRGMEKMPTIDFAAIESEIHRHRDAQDVISQTLAQGNKQAAALRQVQQEAGKTEDAMRKMRQELDDAAKAGVTKAVAEHSKLEREVFQAKSDVQILGSKISSRKEVIANDEATLATLRDQFNYEAEKEYVEPDLETFTCVTCGQALPTETRSQKLKEMKDRFEKNQSDTLDSLTKKAMPIKARTDAAREELSTLEKDLEAKTIRHGEIMERLKELAKEVEIEERRVGPIDYDADPRYAQLVDKLKALQDEINRPTEDAATILIIQKRELEDKISELERTLSSKDAAKKAKERIEELMAEERKLAATLAELNRQKNMIDQFIKAKVEFLDERINGRFKFIRFKLFEIQINGGLKECCEALVNTNGSWVPFADANHAGKVNAGLDVINALAEFYGCTAPIFIDFRESVTEILPTKSQVINLYKNEADKVLRVEVENG